MEELLNHILHNIIRFIIEIKESESDELWILKLFHGTSMD